MNNSRKRKERARLHNLALDERTAYAQDRVEQPEKYKDVKRNREADISWAILLASMNRDLI